MSVVEIFETIDAVLGGERRWRLPRPADGRPAGKRPGSVEQVQSARGSAGSVGLRIAKSVPASRCPKAAWADCSKPRGSARAPGCGDKPRAATAVASSIT